MQAWANCAEFGLSARAEDCFCTQMSREPRFNFPAAQEVIEAMIRSYQGHLPQFPASCYIDLSAQLIGDVTLGERSSVWMNAVLRGDVHSIRVGANSNVQDCAVLHGQRNLTRSSWATG